MCGTLQKNQRVVTSFVTNEWLVSWSRVKLLGSCSSYIHVGSGGCHRWQLLWLLKAWQGAEVRAGLVCRTYTLKTRVSRAPCAGLAAQGEADFFVAKPRPAPATDRRGAIHTRTFAKRIGSRKANILVRSLLHFSGLTVIIIGQEETTFLRRRAPAELLCTPIMMLPAWLTGQATSQCVHNARP